MAKSIREGELIQDVVVLYLIVRLYQEDSNVVSISND